MSKKYEVTVFVKTFSVEEGDLDKLIWKATAFKKDMEELGGEAEVQVQFDATKEGSE